MDYRCNTPTYHSWRSMKERCSNKNHVAYHRYGGRGINFDDSWSTYRNFIDDMGERPKGTSLDRIDNDEGYTKENCRWATHKQQSRNTSFNRWLTVDGEQKTMIEWSEIYGVKLKTIYQRLRCGWSIEEAVKIESFLGKNQRGVL